MKQSKKLYLVFFALVVCIGILGMLSYQNAKYVDFRKNSTRELYKQMLRYEDNLQICRKNPTNSKASLFLEDAKNSIYAADLLLTLSHRYLYEVSLTQKEKKEVVQFWDCLSLFVTQLTMLDLESSTNTGIFNHLEVIGDAIRKSCQVDHFDSLKNFYQAMQTPAVADSVAYILQNYNNYALFAHSKG